MKPVGRFSKIVGCAIAMAGLLTVTTEAMQSRAVVRAVRGTAQYSIGKASAYKPVTVGMIFAPSTTIRTAPDSSVDLFLGDNGPVVRITPDTRLGLDKLTLENTGVEKVIETELDLTSGRILGNVKKLAAASRYEVKTPRGVAAIRGTEYDISADGKVHVISGTVVMVYVVDGRSSSVTINAGQTATPPTTAGERPTVQPTPTVAGVPEFRQDAEVIISSPNPPVPIDSPVQSPIPVPDTPVVTPAPVDVVPAPVVPVDDDTLKAATPASPSGT